MMAGLAGVAAPMIELLLTEKWLPCVPYLQIYCFSLAFYPIHSCNLQAINAMGRSDIFLKLELIKKSVDVILLLIGVFCFDSPIAIALTGACTTVTSCFINAYPNKKLIRYAYMEQMKDIMPSAMTAIVMLAAVLLVGTLALPVPVLLIVQVLAGVLVYAALSVVLRLKPFYFLLNIVRSRKTKEV
jgi:O-antigen/teichoic acid export membrane protein